MTKEDKGMTCNLYINKQYIGKATGMEFGYTPKTMIRDKCRQYVPTSIRCSIKNRCINQDRYNNIILGESDTFGKMVYIQIKDEDENGNESAYDILNGYYVLGGVEFNTTYEGKMTDIIKLIGTNEG